jgi:hypothetical protein
VRSLVTDRPQPGAFIGRLASATQLIFAVLLGAVPLISGLAHSVTTPDIVPRGLVIWALFSVPGLVGLVAVREHRPALLLAAGAASGLGSIIAFSGVTLIFLVPATMFVTAGLRLGARNFVAGETSISAGGLVQIGLAIAVFVLIVGSGVSALFTTESGCWTTYRTPTGVRTEAAPYSTGEMIVPEGAESSGCTTGLLSARGVGLGALLGLGALALAVRGSTRSTKR